jgi:Fe-S cluster assembly protein SufD
MDTVVNAKEGLLKSKSSQLPDGWTTLLESGKSVAHQNVMLGRNLGAKYLNSATWLSSYRLSGLNRLLSQGFPSAKSEDFKYFYMGDLRQQIFSLPASRSDRDTSSLSHHEKVQAAIKDIREHMPSALIYVLIDGVLADEYSSKDIPDGLHIYRGSEAIHELERSHGSAVSPLSKLEDSVQESFLSALCAGFLQEFILISAKTGSVIEQPLVFLSLQAEHGVLSSSQVYVQAHSHSDLSVAQIFLSADEAPQAAMSLSRIDFLVADEAKVQFLKLLHENIDQNIHLGQTDVTIGRAAHFQGTHITLGAHQSRSEGYLNFTAPGSEGILNGVTILSGDQRVDNFTVLKHAEPHCQSHELFKAVVADSAVSSFTGTIIVDEGAQKTNAIQSNQSLLLSERATTNAKPQLKIWADDVKCTHGATVGQIDEEALFYLRSRGVGEKAARSMLMRAFVGDVLKELGRDDFRSFCQTQLDARLDEIVEM